MQLELLTPSHLYLDFLDIFELGTDDYGMYMLNELHEKLPGSTPPSGWVHKDWDSEQRQFICCKLYDSSANDYEEDGVFVSRSLAILYLREHVKCVPTSYKQAFKQHMKLLIDIYM